VTEPTDIAPLDPEALSGRKFDVRTVEVFALTAARTLFGKEGLRIPLKLQDVLDMDLVVQDNNVVLNMNEVHLTAPELSVWRFIFAYRGKPVVEYGRGIKDDMKIHFPQMILLLLVLWRERGRKHSAKARADAAKNRALLALAATHPAAEGP
jgi:hypothetical protein